WEICVSAANACGQTNTNCKYIRGALSTPAPIAGSTVACPSTSGTYSTNAVTGATSYVWTGTNGITFTGSGLSVTANFPAGFSSGSICVSGQLPCGYTGPSRCINVTNGTPLLGNMSGTFTVCPGAIGVSFSVPPSPGANTYNWVLPTGATLVNGTGTNAITVDFGPTFNGGNICVTAQSICGITSLPRCRTIGSNKPATPGNIIGAVNGVCGQTITYSIPAVSGATSYTWTAPAGATLTSLNGTNSIDVTYSNSFTTGNLCVTANNGCGSSTPRCVLAKATPATPGSIGGPAVICAFESGDVYSVATVFGASGYVWTVPSGATIQSGQGTNSILVDWGANGGTITVTASGPCGNSGTKTLNVVMTCKISSGTLPDAALNAYPNPVSNNLTVELDAQIAGTYSVELMDLSGRVVYATRMDAVIGSNSNVIDVANYSKGVYTLNVRNNEGFSKQIRVAIQ
ncbi:MAG TPA: T9SS type A sorting domain-containing protein, partial [Bacteroidia bacterium]|nr:T9SS type A sorting domain-containing protein [Bacteroidia bacterium]